MTDSGVAIICEDCGTPVAERRADGTLVILSRHHGQRHVTVIVAGKEQAVAPPERVT